MKTQAQAKSWINSKVGKGIDWDGMFGYQCMDEAVAYINYVTDGKVTMWGNAKDAINNSFGDTAKVIKNTPSFKPRYGDVVVWTYGNFSTYGHIAIVVNPDPYGDLQYITVLEQNWNGNGIYKTEFATVRTHDYTGVSHFIRPNFATAETKQDKKVETKKKENKEPKNSNKDGIKKQSIKYDRTNINWTMDKRGHNPVGVVLHNDAGGMTGFQYKNNLQNAGYNRWAMGIAHSYISEGQVWQAIGESRVAWHCANQYANKNLYGIEICQSLTSSDAQFLKNEQTAFYEAARLLKKWGLKPNKNTVRLHMEYYQTSCPHRSMALHVGKDPSKTSVTQADMEKMKEYFIKQIKMYYNGKTPTPTVVNKKTKTKPTAKKSSTNGWNINSYGTYYKAENGTFKCTARQGIITRYTAPFVSCEQAGVLYYGQSVNYDTVCKQDGYVWISWTTNDGSDVWMPIRTWDKNTDKIGKLWGQIY